MRFVAPGVIVLGSMLSAASPVAGQAEYTVSPGSALLDLRFDPLRLPAKGPGDLFGAMLAIGPDRAPVRGLVLWSAAGLPYGPGDMYYLITGADHFAASLALLRFERVTGHEWAGMFRDAGGTARQVRLESGACPEREAEEFVRCALARLTPPGNPAASQVVPEPITMVLVGTGLLGVGAAARRRRSTTARG